MSGSTILEKVEAVAIGAFDGMHKAHQELLKRLGHNGAVVVIDKNTATLTPGQERCRYTHYPCFFFDLPSIKHLDAKGFVELLKRTFPNLKKIVVGYDFAFGKDRRYGIEDLRRLFDGVVEVVPEQKLGELSIHSRYIKELLKKGEIELANKMLGRYYSVRGRVVAGQGIGKEELVPTLNVEVEGFLLPKPGVYASYTESEDKRYPSVTFIGHRLSTDGRFSVETHLIGQKLTKTPKEVCIYFVKYLRTNQKFDTLEDLKSQIQKDIQKAKEVL